MARKQATQVIKVVCPNCDTELSIIEFNEQNNKTKANKQMKADVKLEALRKAGVNVDNLFSMKGVNGDEIIARMDGGNLTVVPEDDPIFQTICDNGVIPNPRLFRRWVMAQVFHMLSYRGCYGNEGFVAALQRKGYKYQWKMVLEELRVQAKLAENDMENFTARNRWFNNGTVVDMCHDHIEKLRNYIDGLKIRHCKGIPYVKIKRIDVFCLDLNAKVFVPLHQAVFDIKHAATPWKLYQATASFITLAKKWWMPYDVLMSTSFKDAYKGAGAYFTMKNLILFHGATFKNGCVKLSQKKSLAILEDKANEYANEGWRLFGLMKKLINDSGIDIEKKMAEWRK